MWGYCKKGLELSMVSQELNAKGKPKKEKKA